jgi:hypothetical protein
MANLIERIDQHHRLRIYKVENGVYGVTSGDFGVLIINENLPSPKRYQTPVFKTIEELKNFVTGKINE